MSDDEYIKDLDKRLRDTLIADDKKLENKINKILRYCNEGIQDFIYEPLLEVEHEFSIYIDGFYEEIRNLNNDLRNKILLKNENEEEEKNNLIKLFFYRMKFIYKNFAILHHYHQKYDLEQKYYEKIDKQYQINIVKYNKGMIHVEIEVDLNNGIFKPKYYNVKHDTKIAQDEIIKRYHSQFQSKSYFKYRALTFEKDSNIISKDDYTIKGLKFNHIYFHDAGDQNDPFDTPLRNFLNDKDIKSQYKNGKDYPHLNEFKNVFPKLFEKKLAIFSATDSPLNTLMWSHYGNSHKGICIEYVFDSVASNIGYCDMNYIDNKNITYGELEFYYPELDGLITTKDSTWKYENEFRLMKFLSSDKGECVKYSNDDTQPIKGYVKSIYFGMNCTDDMINQVKSELSSKNITYYKVSKIAGSVYELEEKPIN